MSLSRKPQRPSKRYIGRDKPNITIIQEQNMHWSELQALKPKDTKPRKQYEQGDLDNRIDYDQE